MKKLLLTAVLPASVGLIFYPKNMHAALTGRQLSEVIKWEDSEGYVYFGPHQLNQIDEHGKPVVTQITLFYRASDATYECFALDSCFNVIQAVSQLVGSRLMVDWLKQSQCKTTD
jgi:hypothetical protein